MMTKPKITLCVLLTLLAGCASSQQKAEQAKAKDPRYQYSLGVFYLNGGNPDEAIKYLNRCLGLDPRYHLAYNAMGLALSMKGNLEEAAKSYEHCLEIAPDFSEARNNLGSVYQELGFVDKAEAEFLKVIGDRNYPTKELPNYNLARLCFTKGDFDQAMNYVEAAVKLNPRFAMAHNLKGLILESQGKLDDAVDSYKQAVKIVPEDINFNFNLGSAYFKNKQWGNAEGVFQGMLTRITDPKMKEQVNSYLKEIKSKGGPAR